MTFQKFLASAAFTIGLTIANQASAGPIFLTGHDPDFHSVESLGAQTLLKAGLNFVTGGTYDDGGAGNKFLWVESRISVPGGHRVGENGLGLVGLTLGVNYDRANAAEFATVNLSSYTAIVIASSFGGLLTRDELDALIARKTDIAAFVNTGRGLMALAECDNCGADLLGVNPNLFGYLPLPGVVATGTSGPYTVTAAGNAAPFFLTSADLNDPTHNSFSSTGGLLVLDTQPDGNAVTLAGNVGITETEFTPSGAPAPGALALVGLGLFGLGALRRRSK